MLQKTTTELFLGLFECHRRRELGLDGLMSEEWYRRGRDTGSVFLFSPLVQFIERACSGLRKLRDFRKLKLIACEQVANTLTTSQYLLRIDHHSPTQFDALQQHSFSER